MCSKGFLTVCLLLLPAFAAAPAYAAAPGGGPSAVMLVSATVVNTCHFGRTASCALPGTSLLAGTAPVERMKDGTQRRVHHL